MKQFRTAMTRLLNALAGVSFLLMVVLTCWQVFTRYVLKNPSSWSEELVSYLFAWMSLLGAAIVTGERGHMNIPVLAERMPESAKRIFSVLAELSAFLFSAVVLVFGGVRITALAMGQMTSSLRVPVGIFYTVLPLAGILNMIYTAMNLCDIFTGRTFLFSETAIRKSESQKQEGN